MGVELSVMRAFHRAASSLSWTDGRSLASSRAGETPASSRKSRVVSLVVVAAGAATCAIDRNGACSILRARSNAPHGRPASVRARTRRRSDGRSAGASTPASGRSGRPEPFRRAVSTRSARARAQPTRRSQAGRAPRRRSQALGPGRSELETPTARPDRARRLVQLEEMFQSSLAGRPSRARHPSESARTRRLPGSRRAR